MNAINKLQEMLAKKKNNKVVENLKLMQSPAPLSPKEVKNRHELLPAVKTSSISGRVWTPNGDQVHAQMARAYKNNPEAIYLVRKVATTQDRNGYYVNIVEPILVLGKYPKDLNPQQESLLLKALHKDVDNTYQYHREYWQEKYGSDDYPTVLMTLRDQGIKLKDA